MVARVVRIENKKLPMKDATKGMQVIGLGDGAVVAWRSARERRAIKLARKFEGRRRGARQVSGLELRRGMHARGSGIRSQSSHQSESGAGGLEYRYAPQDKRGRGLRLDLIYI